MMVTGGENVGEEHYAMLLCRVCLGEMKRIRDFDKGSERTVIESDKYSSLLVKRDKNHGIYREFIVYDEGQVTPAISTPGRDMKGSKPFFKTKMILKIGPVWSWTLPKQRILGSGLIT